MRRVEKFYAINHAFPQGLNNILSGLKNEALYKVYINEHYIKSFATTDCGTGYFNIASSLNQNEIYVQFVAYLPKSGVASDVEHDGKQLIALEIYPSLFRDITNIKLQITDGCNATIAVYDVSGRLVKTFSDLTNELSKHKVIRWNGCDNTGTKLASGVYFLELHAGDYTETRKLLLIRR